MKLLEVSGAEISGAEAVVIGRSMLVGKPVAMLLLAQNATVTIAHSRTKDLAAVCRRADILVPAVGRPDMVKADWVKPGAVVIDVGINRIPDATRKSRSHHSRPRRSRPHDHRHANEKHPTSRKAAGIATRSCGVSPQAVITPSRGSPPGTRCPLRSHLAEGFNFTVRPSPLRFDCGSSSPVSSARIPDFET